MGKTSNNRPWSSGLFLSQEAIIDPLLKMERNIVVIFFFFCRWVFAYGTAFCWKVERTESFVSCEELYLGDKIDIIFTGLFKEIDLHSSNQVSINLVWPTQYQNVNIIIYALAWGVSYKNRNYIRTPEDEVRHCMREIRLSYDLSCNLIIPNSKFNATSRCDCCLVQIQVECMYCASLGASYAT